MKATFRVLATVIVVGVVTPISAAFAKDGRDTIVRTTCSEGSSATLKLSPEDGRIEVEFDLDQNRNGVVWRWGLARNGRTIASGRATTRLPSGSFDIRRVVRNAPGADRISVRATRANGEVCTARATFGS